jgi:sodium/pantothenate symporter
MIILLIVYSVGQFKAMGAVWSLTTGTDWLWSGIITAALCAVYLAIGGYTGTQFSLAIQGGIFVVIGWIFGIASIFWAGGPDKIAASLANATYVKTGGAVTPLSLGNYTVPLAPSFPGYDWLGVTATLFMFLFMATGFPHNIARFLGCRKTTKREYSILMLIVAVGCVTPLMVGAMGLAARAVWGGQLMNASMSPIYGDAAASLASMAIGGSVGGAVFSMAVFAAAVSTLAGMVMVMATNVTRDLIQTVRPKTSSRGLLQLSRLLIIPFVAIPLYWYLFGTPPVLSEFMAGSAVAQGGIFFFVVAFSMYWKRATKWGAVATIVYGMVVSLLHPSVLGKSLPPFNSWGVWALALMFGCALVYIGVSLLTKPLPEDKMAKLFSKEVATCGEERSQ